MLTRDPARERYAVYSLPLGATPCGRCGGPRMRIGDDEPGCLNCGARGPTRTPAEVDVAEAKADAAARRAFEREAKAEAKAKPADPAS